MKRIILALLLLAAVTSPAAMTVTTITTAPDGTVTQTTYEVGDSFAMSIFPGIVAKRGLVGAPNADGTTGALVTWIAGITDSTGAVFTVGPNGEVYKDGARLGTNKVAKLVQLGTSVYGIGKTDGKLWRWLPTGWALITDYDANLVKFMVPKPIQPPLPGQNP